MNDRTRQALETILKQKDSWKANELRYGQVLSKLSDALQSSFYDQWYWPTAKIIFKWIKKDLPCLNWEVLDVGFEKSILLDYCYSLELADTFEEKCADMVSEVWAEWLEIPEYNQVMVFAVENGLQPEKEPEQLNLF